MTISADHYDELVTIRHHIHENPELSGQEFETTAYLKAYLEGLNIEILETGLKTGLVAQVGQGEPVIALRADIDALPILENTGLSFASKNAGVMHACGHDLHQTSLLGAAKILKQREAELKGTVKLIFQHAEEAHFGANEVLDTGILSDVQAIIGYHNMPTLPVGQIGIRAKGVMAAVDQFFVTVTGVGSHAAYPHEGVDSIVATSAIVSSLQQIVSRNMDPQRAVVVSVTHMTAGNTWNVLPDTAIFEGTIRTFNQADRLLAKQRFYDIVEHVAKAYGVTAEIDWILGTNVTYNDPKLSSFLFDETSRWHDDVVVPELSNAGEDFAAYQEHIPGVFAFIGSNAPGSPGLHFSDMTVKDETLPVAVDYYVNNTFAILEKLGK
ncbi:amidohydrolase [Lactococcus raffinolactis]|jgi:amidohydrolase|uniref:amidohydrolase n=1 Tax=Pseudolactococcus raffinolactis TaxID=1366 RepID=UPI001436C40A|nr:amidohydrolase [Lactococcus raffinolactis]MCH4162778.1 amidohydrolase [Lactococcus raffinolactis]QIW60395.1 amidohydrolase [Lactococcus raffinolactis]